ncbi:GNAT family N-acetyltransferase [Arthrobacter sp. I2-34]|uniref:GNAT family N-acetyltransferase n=1 Tax=Arthrobacter hankyongi TaxID=2904801 RepID=A0ABS9LDW9_9MICC|nr:GNAT family N-acetyltransferase [Arthrobacter hankyongi]MCG2624874.1 GNAT family N-acetyltransferase [Arthrobacter hankyongi]
MTPQDWQVWRDLRLLMLADYPIAFTESLAQAGQNTDAQWRESASRSTGKNSVSVLASDPAEDGQAVGTMSCYVEEDGTAWLAAVWVAPAYRGSGLAARLLAEILGWVREESGAKILKLGVHEDNLRALAFYRRHGFIDRGEREPYLLDAARQEIILELPTEALDA